MTDTKPTPGPWSLDKWNDICAGSDLVICAVGRGSSFKSTYYTPSKSETLANARLIAAAPELLDVLTAIKGALDMGFSPAEILAPSSEIRLAVDAAIVKAEGRT
jgi:hypothetical protein